MIKLIKKFLSLILVCTLFTSCVNTAQKYDSSRIISNFHNANLNTFADGAAKNILVPDILNEIIVDNVGADAYYIASTNRFSSNYTKFHNPYKKLPIASLTKLMTALVVFRNCKDLNEKYYVTTESVDLERDVSKANLKAGDELSVRDLLYGLIVPSGNDAALALAENLSGLDNFVIMMNNEAERLGAMNTHFANPHGLDSEHHFSTAYDLFLIMRELLKYDEFKKMSTTKEYSAKIKASDGTERIEKWLNTNYFVTEELMISQNVELLAGKTGNTKVAGSCLALLTKDKKNGDEYISIVLNAKSKRNSYYNSNAILAPISK